MELVSHARPTAKALLACRDGPRWRRRSCLLRGASIAGFPDFPLKGRRLNIWGKQKCRSGVEVSYNSDDMAILGDTLIFAVETGARMARFQF